MADADADADACVAVGKATVSTDEVVVELEPSDGEASEWAVMVLQFEVVVMGGQ